MGSKKLSWHDAAVIARYLPEESALREKERGYPLWSLMHEFLAQIADGMRLLNWQSQGSAAKTKDRPKPRMRPWEKPKHLSAGELEKTPNRLVTGVIGVATTLRDARARLKALNGRAPGRDDNV